MRAGTARARRDRPDGACLPGGLRGDAIPVAGRIVAVADAYCTLTASLSPGHALAQMESQRGTAYEARVVAALRDAINEGT